MQKLQARTTASLITLCAVVLAMLLGANLTLNRMRQEAWDIYLYGLDYNGTGIESDLESAVSEAVSLAKLAQFYLDTDHSAMRALDLSIDAYNQAHTVSEKGAAASQLQEAVEALRTVMEAQNLSDNDQSVLNYLVANIKSSFLIIRQSGYNEAARSFNSTLRTFPGGFLGNLTGVKPLELFE